MLSPSGSSPSGLAIRSKNLKHKVFFSVIRKQKKQTVDIKCVISCEMQKANKLPL